MELQFFTSSITTRYLLVVILIVVVTTSIETRSISKLPPEWHLWKTQHGKGYSSDREELYRHTVWQSNKKFIETHNLFNHTFGYTLAMNEFGDLVCFNCYTFFYRNTINS